MKNSRPAPIEHNGMWPRASIEIIISEFRKRKCLYDQTHQDYLNRNKRQACLEGICKILLDKLSLKVTTDHVKAKIQILRSQFNKDLRGLARSKKYKPKFWCFKKLEWLKPYCNNRYTLSSYDAAASNSNSNTTMMNEQTPHIFANGDVQKTEDRFQYPEQEYDTSMQQYSEQDYHRTTRQIHSDRTSTTTLEDETAMSSSNVLTSKLVETVLDEPNNDNMEDINDQFYETIALTQQIVQNRVTAKEQRAANGKTRSWEGELVKSQLDLISDETIRSDTMWEIQCVLRRGIEQDRVLPKRRKNKNRRPSVAHSEASANGSYISLNSNESYDDNNANDTTSNVKL